jgi:hypothetical protein
VKARAKLMNQAGKALYCLYRKLRNISIPIDLQFKLQVNLQFPMMTKFSNITKADLHISKSFRSKLFGLHSHLRKYYYQVKLGSHSNMIYK